MKRKIMSTFAAFLAVMLLFTVLSRAADNITIARVTVKRPEQGKVTHKVSGSGKVQSNREQAVAVIPGQVIRTIYVEEGQQVASGDLLFEVDTETLREDILKQKQEMKKAELQSQDGASEREARRQRSQVEQNRAAEDYNVAAGKGSTAVSRAWADLQSAKKQLEILKEGKTSGDGADSVQAALAQACEDKKKAYELAVKEEKELEKAIDEAVESALAGTSSAGTIRDTARLIQPVREVLMEAPEDSAEERIYETEMPESETPLPEASAAEPPEPEPFEPEAPVDEAPVPEPTAPEASVPETSAPESPVPEPSVPEVSADVVPEAEMFPEEWPDEQPLQTEPEESGSRDTDNDGAAWNQGTDDGSGEWEQIVGEDTQAQETAPRETEDPYLLEQRIRLQNQPLLDAAKEEADKREQEWKEAKTALDAYLQEKAAGTQTGASAMKEQVEEDIRAKQRAYDDAVTAANDSLRTAGRAVEDAALPEGSDSTGEIDAITREQAELELAKLERLMRADGRVLSPIDGTVLRVNITTGDRTTDGTAILLADRDSGNRLVVQVSEDQDEYIARGDAVTVTTANGREKRDDLTVDNVRANEEDAKLLDVTVQLPAGFLEEGMPASMETVRDSVSYRCRIPLQALYTDNGKNFVYVVVEKESVMGTEQIARRIDVTVLDKNETDAALTEGALASDAMLIIASDKMLSDGSRVRVEE